MSAKKLLIIDDEATFREDLAVLLRRRGYEVATAGEAEAGIAAAACTGPDVVLCDIAMPGASGIEALDRILAAAPESAVIMLTAHGTLETAVDAFRKGAHDYLLKPVLIEDLEQKLVHALAERDLRREVRSLRRQLGRGLEHVRLVGAEGGLREVMRVVERIAASRSPVLIRGETGTGKERVARALHELGDPPGREFVAINCAALPETLLESELFGYVAGAFTGAEGRKPGLFELADGGTLFLDELPALTPPLQAKLLRAIEEKEFRAVGATRPVKVDVRFVAATQVDLHDLAAQGAFRADLLYRLSVVEVVLPPLRERRQDIPALVDAFVQRFRRELGRKVQGVDGAAMRHLLAYGWPGNVRQLENAIERAVLLGADGLIRPADLPPEIAGAGGYAGSGAGAPDDLREALRTYEREHIRAALLVAGGNREETARRLGIDRSTLYRKMTDLGLIE